VTKSEAILGEIVREFPGFRIRKKAGSRLQRAIDVGLRIVTLCGQRVYLTRYHTLLGRTLWVPDAWQKKSDEFRYRLLRHERVHLRQSRRLGVVLFGLLYFLPLPMFLSYGRARLEWEAYEESIRAMAETRGIEAARRMKDGVVARFTGPAYGWMWPFPRTVGRWFDRVVRELEKKVP